MSHLKHLRSTQGALLKTNMVFCNFHYGEKGAQASTDIKSVESKFTPHPRCPLTALGKVTVKHCRLL